MVIIKGVLVFLALVLVVIAVFLNGKYVKIQKDKFIVRGKYFGEDRDIRAWITPNETSLPTFRGTEMEKIVQAYNYLEEHYKYVPDTHISWTNGNITLKGNGDFWQPPVLTQAIITAKGLFEGDCEDGAFWLQSVLEKNKVKNSYVCIGTVELSSGTYGHAWVIWKNKGKEYLLETTLGTTMKTLKTVPSFYHADFILNSEVVYAITGADINDVITTPPLPPADVNELRKILGG